MERFRYEDLEKDKWHPFHGCFSSTPGMGISWISAAMLVLNAVLAPGIISLPKAFSRSGGIGIGVGIQLLLLVFIVGSLYVLVYCAQVNAQETYPDVVRVMCSPAVEVASALCVMLYCYTFCISSLILIGDQLEKFFSDVYGTGYWLHWYMARPFLLPVTSLLFILPLCFVKNLEFLTKFSMLGNAAVLYCVVLVIIKFFSSKTQHGDLHYRPRPMQDILSMIPIWCGNYQCHVELVPIASTLRQRNFKWFSLTILSAIFACASFYTLTAIFGYLTFGDLVKPDILLQYTSSPEVTAATIAMAVKLCMTYPILHFCGRKALENLWVRARRLAPAEVLEGELVRRIVISLLTFTVVVIISVLVPNMAIIVPILGSCSATLMFIFPGCLMVQLYRFPADPGKKCPGWLLLAAILMTSLGGFVVVFTWFDLWLQEMTDKDFLETGLDVLKEMSNTTDLK